MPVWLQLYVLDSVKEVWNIEDFDKEPKNTNWFSWRKKTDKVLSRKCKFKIEFDLVCLHLGSNMSKFHPLSFKS